MLDEREREYWREKFRAEIEADHLQDRNSSHRLPLDEQRQREADLARLRQEVREEFLKSQGYVPCQDSRGFIHYVHPEELARRERRRAAHKKKKRWTVVREFDYESVILYLGLGVFAVGVVFALAR